MSPSCTLQYATASANAYTLKCILFFSDTCTIVHLLIKIAWQGILGKGLDDKAIPIFRKVE